jgi:uncharacterized protein YdaU (DUF1376 family)
MVDPSCWHANNARGQTEAGKSTTHKQIQSKVTPTITTNEENSWFLYDHHNNAATLSKLDNGLPVRIKKQSDAHHAKWRPPLRYHHYGTTIPIWDEGNARYVNTALQRYVAFYQTDKLLWHSVSDEISSLHQQQTRHHWRTDGRKTEGRKAEKDTYDDVQGKDEADRLSFARKTIGAGAGLSFIQPHLFLFAIF